MVHARPPLAAKFKHYIHSQFMSFLVQVCVPQIPVVQAYIVVKSASTHTHNVECVVREGRK